MQGCLSIANILLGAGLLSIPYAMTLSGASGLIVIALCCLLFNTSGKFIAWGLDMLPPGLQGKGYPDLGFAALGDTGRHLVTLAAILELFGGACMELLILWRSLQVRFMFVLVFHGRTRDWCYHATTCRLYLAFSFVVRPKNNLLKVPVWSSEFRGGPCRF